MIYNLGSVNADIFYDVAHIPVPGETLAAHGVRRGLGGKGANQSVAIARAGARVKHIGAVGADGQWMIDRMSALGVDISLVRTTTGESGHAIITVAADGENAITLFGGANQALQKTDLQSALSDIGGSDWLVLQNETNGQDHAAKIAKAAGARVVYSAAPFDISAVQRMLPVTDILVVNKGEADALMAALNVQDLTDIAVPKILVTYGAQGAALTCRAHGTTHHVDGVSVSPVDTTGAGDTFLGYFVAARSQGLTEKQALTLANKAAALKVTRKGTADAIPTRAQVDAFQP